MKTIYAQIDKRLVDEMPPELFKGSICEVSTIEECHKAVDCLCKADLLGIDTETRPNFQSGSSYKVSLLQIATDDQCFLFRLNMIGIPDSLHQLLSSNEPLKIGLSLKDDIHALERRRKIKMGKYVELQQMVKEVGILDMSLQKIYANLFGLRISKNKRLTNWEAPVLTDAQKRYAATDAWACLRIYRELMRFRTGEDYEYIAPMNDERMFQLWQKVMLETIEN